MNNLAHSFWSIVAEPGDPSDVEIGDAVRVERGGVRVVKIIANKYDTDEGMKITIRDPAPGETYQEPNVIIICEDRE